MTLTPETLVIALVFLVPGFLANWLAQYYAPRARPLHSAFDSTLASLAISVAVLFIIAALASVALTVLWAGWRETFESLELNVLVEEGIRSYFQEQPLLVAGVLGGSALAAYVVAVLVGYFDVASWVLRRHLLRRHLTDRDMWFAGLELTREEWNRAHAYVEVRMKGSRDVFWGVVKGFSFPNPTTGERDLLIEDVTYLPMGDPARSTKFAGPPPSVAVLSSRDIESVHVVYVN